MPLLPLFNPSAPPTTRGLAQPISPAAQEQPYHPVARASFSSGPDVAPPPQIQAMVVDPNRMNGGVLQTVAQALVVAGTIFANVAAPPQVSAAVVRQEQPSHPGSQFGAGVPPAPTVAPNVLATLGRQELPDHPLPKFWAGVHPATIADPPRLITAVFGRQELPDHPGAWFALGIQAPAASIPVASALVKQDQPFHPPSQFWSGNQPANVAAPPQIQSVLVRQEQPRDAYAIGLRGPQGPDVRAPIVDRAVVRQQLPDHPPSQFWRGVRPDNVAAPPQIGAVLGRQEQPRDAYAISLRGPQGPDVAAPPQIQRAIVPQEQPGHPSPIFQPSLPPAVTIQPGTRSFVGTQEQPREGYFAAVWPSKVGPNVNVAASPQITSSVIQGAEQPREGYAQLRRGVRDPDVRAPVTDRLIQGQEQPGPAYTVFAAAAPTVAVIAPPLSPRARLVPEREEPRQPVARIAYAPVLFVPPVFAPPVGQFVGGQEQPFHPGSRAWAGVQVQEPNIAPRDRYVVTRQEQPWHPGPALQAGVPGPDIRPYPAKIVSFGPERPDHPPSRFWKGRHPDNVAAPPQIGRAIVGQEQPYHPPPTLNAGVTPKTTFVAAGRSAIVPQQFPDHPVGPLSPGVISGTIIRVPVLDRILGSQEQPDHPGSRFWPSFQSQNIGSPVTRGTIGAREQPHHPPSRFWSGGQPSNVAAPPQIGRAVTVQEQPRHPGSLFAAGKPSQTGAPETRSFVGVRYQPDHPASGFWRGAQPSNTPPPPQIVDHYLGRQEQPRDSFVVAIRGVRVADARIPVTDRLIKGQEQPRPAAWVFAAQVPVPASSASLASRARLVPEREEPRQPVARMGYVGGIQFRPTHTPDLARTLVTVQEQPAHPGSLVPTRVFPVTVRTQFLATITKQEQPFHPGPRVWPGLPPTDPPQAATRRVHFQQPQEQPSHPGSLLVASPQRQNVAVVAARLVPVRQDQPYHPVARPAYSTPTPPPGTLIWGIGVWGINAWGLTPQPLAFPVVGGQQIPDQPRSVLLGSITASAAVPVTPDHETPCTFIADPPVPENPGLALTVARALGPDVAAVGHIRRIIQGQERPADPPALLRHALLNPPPPAVFIPPNQRQISTVQPPPYHPTARHHYFNPIPGPLPGTDVGPARPVLLVAQEQSAQTPNIVLVSSPLTAAVPIIGDLETPVSFIPDPPVPENPGLALAAPGVVGNIVTAPPVPRRLLQSQEVPYQPRAAARYFATRSNVALVNNRLITRQEQPDQKQPVLWARSDNTGPRLDNTRIVRQEQPGQPGNLFGWRAVGNVASGIRSWTITVQELPAQPASRFFVGDAMLSESTQRGITRSVLARQEQPNHPLPSLYSGVVPANVVTGVTNSVLTGQEQPSHPLPATYSGVVPSNVGTGIRRDLVTTQEQPDHPASVFLGFIPATALSAVSRSLVTVQQQPDHPAGIFQSRSGILPNVAPEVRGAAITTQEQPFHPASVLRTAPSFIVGTAVTGLGVIKGQDQPDHPRGVLVPSQQTQNVLPAVASSTIGRQEPSLPGALVSWPGVFPRNVAPTIKAIGTAQEAPDHPASRLFAGVRPVDVGARITRDWAILVQEQPFHPPSLLGVSIQAQLVKQQIVDSVLGQQEQPSHPGNVFVPALPPPNVASNVQRVLVGPQFPDHPASVLTASQANDPAPPRGVLIQGQEVPGEPRQWTIIRVEKTIASVIPGTVVVGQEQPDLGYALTVATFQTQTVRVAVLDRVLGVQEPPDHQPGLVASSGAPPSVTAIVGSILARQEQPGQPENLLAAGVATGFKDAARPYLLANPVRPDQPASFLAGGVSGEALPGLVQALFVGSQEQPQDASAQFGAGPQPIFVTVPSEPRDWVITIQEMPGQPGSMLEGASVFTALVIVPVPTLLGSEPSVTLQGSEPGFTLLGSTPSPKLGGSV